MKTELVDGASGLCPGPSVVQLHAQERMKADLSCRDVSLLLRRDDALLGCVHCSKRS